MYTVFPYFDNIVEANKLLAGTKKFYLYPGMTFGSREKWWPDKGIRPTDHEGLDICYYVDATGVEKGFSKDICVPVMASGTIMAICGDYLGLTVFLDHGIEGSLREVSVYAHIVPYDFLRVGQQVKAGAVIGTIADTEGRKNRMPAHLHLSFMKIAKTITSDVLDWNFICNVGRVSLVDPLLTIDHKTAEIVNSNHWKEKEMAGI